MKNFTRLTILTLATLVALHGALWFGLSHFLKQKVEEYRESSSGEISYTSSVSGYPLNVKLNIDSIKAKSAGKEEVTMTAEGDFNIQSSLFSPLSYTANAQAAVITLTQNKEGLAAKTSKVMIDQLTVSGKTFENNLETLAVKNLSLAAVEEKTTNTFFNLESLFIEGTKEKVTSDSLNTSSLFKAENINLINLDDPAKSANIEEFSFKTYAFDIPTSEELIEAFEHMQKAVEAGEKEISTDNIKHALENHFDAMAELGSQIKIVDLTLKSGGISILASADLGVDEETYPVGTISLNIQGLSELAKRDPNFDPSNPMFKMLGGNGEGLNLDMVLDNHIIKIGQFMQFPLFSLKSVIPFIRPTINISQDMPEMGMEMPMEPHAEMMDDGADSEDRPSLDDSFPILDDSSDAEETVEDAQAQ